MIADLLPLSLAVQEERILLSGEARSLWSAAHHISYARFRRFIRIQAFVWCAPSFLEGAMAPIKPVTIRSTVRIIEASAAVNATRAVEVREHLC